ncbi:MAG: BNR repeat-containing protein [Bacteroides sp.]|nr:BNR repeat-containing protein [Roseburia sp.]MCM1346398.1 BNR repeat-containing protein [Bacteroides sp.]MCM1420959.1 BNR repeat-containing protein [Bacteroides sp.]
MDVRKMMAVGLFVGSVMVGAQTVLPSSENIVASEGAWCWFADPRALHYKNGDGSINSAYIGYIDVHGAIKASQISFPKKGEVRQEDVLVRSRFQPDDHNNPTFLVLPDERVMIFYARHTDEPCFYYRISKRKGDITELGDEHEIKVENNTTYPSPFILSDDPEHIYLCWRGIHWHPTIAKLSMPDAQDKVRIEWGPYQIVQSTGARPYAKYQSNGKDKIYMAYTTGHPDNEYPNWLYFNVIELNAKKDGKGGITTTPTLTDLKKNVLTTIQDGVFNVDKSDDYKVSYSNTLIDSPSDSRDWVWQIALDKKEKPVVAMVRISNDKQSHEYYYARWDGKKWNLTDLVSGGGKFHSSNTEYCYSGGMALDPENISDVYLSVPTENTVTGNSVYEIWKYQLASNGAVSVKKQITHNSEKNNMRPFVLPGSKKSGLRLCWMNGDYYYWLVRKGYPLGYPTSIKTDYTLPVEKKAVPQPEVSAEWNKSVSSSEMEIMKPRNVHNDFTYAVTWSIDHNNYGGVLLRAGELEYGLDKTSLKPYVKVGDTVYQGQNVLGTSDAWATESGGTDGRWYLTKLDAFTSVFTYDSASRTLTVYRDGWIDQRISDVEIRETDCMIGGFDGKLLSGRIYNACLPQSLVRCCMK